MRYTIPFIYALSLLTACISAETDSILTESKVKTIYIMQFSHLDIGYTHTQAEVAKIAIDTLDNVLEFCKKEPDYKWTVESLWQLEQWMNNRDENKINELMEYVKAGRIGLTACYAGLHSAPMGYEEFCRHMYFMNKLRVDYGIDINTAIQNDIAGYSLAYPQVFKKSGIKYFATGINTFIGAGADIPVKDRPFFWEGPDGSRVLTFIAHDPFIGGSGYVNALLYYGWGISDGKADTTVPQLLRNLEKSSYPYDSILVMSGGKSDNQNTNMELLEGIRDWNKRHESPKMVLCTPDEFFDHIASKYGDSFPVYKGDWAGLWDQVKQSLPYGAGLARIAHDSLPAAESLSLFADMLGKHAYRKASLDDAWRNLIAWEEHSGNGAEPKVMTIEQAREDSKVKLNYAADAYNSAQEISAFAIAPIAEEVRSTGKTIFVWNPYLHIRTTVAKIKLPYDMSNFTIADNSTGKETIYHTDSVTGETSILAEDIPGIGYKTFSIEPKFASDDNDTDICIGENYLENKYIRIEIDKNGMVSGIYDKKLKKEFIQTGSRYGFGELIHADDRMIGNGEYKSDKLSDPQIHAISRGNLGGSLLITGKNSPLISTEITLYSNRRAVYVKHIVDKSKMPKGNFKYDIAYPLSVPDGKLLYDTPAGYMDAQTDRMPKAFPIIQTTHGGVIYSKDFGITISTKQAMNWEFGKMNSWWGGIYPPDSTILLTRIMNNTDFYEFKEGHGEYMQEFGAPSKRVYECIFMPHGNEDKTSAAESLNMLISEAQPMLCAASEANPTGKLPAGKGQLLKITGSGITLLALKRAEDGRGYILRLMETAGESKKISIGSGYIKIKSAGTTDITERDTGEILVRNGRISTTIAPREILTIRINHKDN